MEAVMPRYALVPILLLGLPLSAQATTQAECDSNLQGCLAQNPYDCGSWNPIELLQCVAFRETCDAYYETCVGNIVPTQRGTDDHPADDQDAEDTWSVCVGDEVGADPPEGQCQNYTCGGATGVHLYTCCNFTGGTECDGDEYDGASDEDYCGMNGENNGKGRAMGAPFDAECDDAADCVETCDDHLLGANVPGFCWSWTLCWNECMDYKERGLVFLPEEVDYAVACAGDDAPSDCECLEGESSDPTLCTLEDTGSADSCSADTGSADTGSVGSTTAGSASTEDTGTAP